MRMGPLAAGLLGLAPFVTGAAHAEVIAKSDVGFVSRNAVQVTATPAETWAVLVKPATWWLAQHTFSGEATNLTLDAVAGGCFCERLPVPPGAPKGQQAGGVQHMRVIYIDPGKAIRLSGALGPLQSEALTGTLTITIKPGEGGTRVLFEYVVGGFMRYNPDEIGPAVDKVLGAQLAALAAKLGPVVPPPAVAPPPPEPAQQPPVEETRGSPELSRSGKVWSLPPAPGSKPPAAKAPPPASKHLAAPMPAQTPPVKKPVDPRPIPPKPAAPAKPAPKPSPSPVDKDKQDGIAAFDQALGKD